MKVFPEIQQQGEKAYYQNIPKRRNPYQYVSLKNEGIAKQAAWSTGWEKAKKNHIQHLEDGVKDEDD